MLFHPFSVVSLTEITDLSFSPGNTSHCGIIFCTPQAKNIIHSQIDGISYYLSPSIALFLRTEPHTKITFNYVSPYLRWLEIKINHVDLLESMAGITAYIQIDHSFHRSIELFLSGKISLDQLNQKTELLLSGIVSQIQIIPSTSPVMDISSSPTKDICFAIYCYLDTNISEDISVTQLAAAVNLSPRQLNTILQNNFGCSAAKFINQFRISRAKQYLLSTDLTITEISALVGFKSIHYFSRIFSKEEGCSPQAFRNTLPSE